MTPLGPHGPADGSGRRAARPAKGTHGFVEGARPNDAEAPSGVGSDKIDLAGRHHHHGGATTTGGNHLVPQAAYRPHAAAGGNGPGDGDPPRTDEGLRPEGVDQTQGGGQPDRASAERAEVNADRRCRLEPRLIGSAPDFPISNTR